MMNSVVSASFQEYTHIIAYTRASRELNMWISGARMLALLIGALESGVLDALYTRVTPEQIASDKNIDLQKVIDLCLALESCDIATREGDCYQLSPDFALLAAPTAAVSLASVIRQADVMMRTLQTVAVADVTYTTLPSEDILAMAKGAGISAMSTSPHVSQELTGKMLPEVEALWKTGARHLEVGSGVGNSLFGVLLTYPLVTAVGIEIDELTAVEAERRASQLGLMERVELRRMDACELQDENSYDTIQWSQFFFPAAIRSIVLDAMQRALKPGGYLVMPLLDSLTDSHSTRRGEMLRLGLRSLSSGSSSFLSFLNDVLRDSPGRRKMERRFASLQRLLFNRWGVPVRSKEELQAEIESSGFRVLRTMYTPVNQFALTRGFLLAQRKII